MESVSDNILLFASTTLHNQLLAEYISQHGDYPCLLVDDAADDLMKHVSSAALILFEEGALEPLLIGRLLQRIYQLGLRVPVGFIGLGPQSRLHQFAHWPQVNGLFERACNPAELLAGIASILDGRYALPESTVANLLARLRHQPSVTVDLMSMVTSREQQILELLQVGASNRDIAKALDLSPHTIKTHLYNLFKKLGVNNRTQAVQRLEPGWLGAVCDDS